MLWAVVILALSSLVSAYEIGEGTGVLGQALHRAYIKRKWKPKKQCRKGIDEVITDHKEDRIVVNSLNKFKKNFPKLKMDIKHANKEDIFNLFDSFKIPRYVHEELYIKLGSRLRDSIKKMAERFSQDFQKEVIENLEELVKDKDERKKEMEILKKIFEEQGWKSDKILKEIEELKKDVGELRKEVLQKFDEIKDILKSSEIYERAPLVIPPEKLCLNANVKSFTFSCVTVELHENLKIIRKILNEVLADRLAELCLFGLLKGRDRISTRELLNVRRLLEEKIKSKRPPPESLFFAAVSFAAAVKTHYAISLADNQHILGLRNYFDRLKEDKSKAAKLLLDDPRVKKAEVLIRKGHIENFKLQKIVKIVKEQLELKEISKIIIFTYSRDISALVMSELNKIPPVRAREIVESITWEEDGWSKQKVPEEIIEKFNQNEYNVLVTTNIPVTLDIEEEIHRVPQTDIVVFYEPVPSEIISILRLGMAGKIKLSKVIVLVPWHPPLVGRYLEDIPIYITDYEILRY